MEEIYIFGVCYSVQRRKHAEQTTYFTHGLEILVAVLFYERHRLLNMRSVTMRYAISPSRSHKCDSP